ncbi:response regulator [Dorea acetigenes]|uniref:Stage 0 sporulation protein A homolog n=1 Tax=Dorea acetigenes TaxID=2981787 RepID=A0ABT2RK35_9FIRM|nr:response regulator [Dorea acetigenes]MCB6415877.1 response regulator [Faecalimonas umbilicata]MCU6685765.1 response regulator [Dorea acetigenes]SCI62189.1 Chemotaxis protein CheY [uncultured Clostridium sp.]
MKFYLLDDDRTITNILKIIIQKRNLGEVCGTSTHAVEALEDIRILKPDIIITDLLMPEMDGITFVKKAKEILPDAACIMLSQVASKDMIENAYEEGIEFYIQKPLNSVEAEKVIQTVSRNLSMQRTLQKMQNIFEDSVQTSVSPTPQKQKDYLPKLQKILQRLGIIGDAGSKDIITIIEYLIEEKEDVTNTTLHELCSHFTDSPKTMEQRIRRAAANGMVNLAHLGLEDYGNEIFTEYANSLYNFEQVRKEMDFIRGKTNKHGNIKIRNFLNALLISCQE